MLALFPLTVVGFVIFLQTPFCQVASVVSNSVRPQRRQPTRPPRPWDSPGKYTGVGCHFLLQCMKVKSESEVTQLCPTQRPQGLQPTRFLRPWDFPGKSTGVGAIAFSAHMLQLYLNFLIFYVNYKQDNNREPCNSPPGSS